MITRLATLVSITIFSLIAITPLSFAAEPHVSEIPDWIKNTAGWWADGQIDDGSFVSGVQWLISNGIMTVSYTHLTLPTIYSV